MSDGQAQLGKQGLLCWQPWQKIKAVAINISCGTQAISPEAVKADQTYLKLQQHIASSADDIAEFEIIG